MSTQETFANAYPVEVQLRSEHELRLFWQAKAEAAEKRRIPPEQAELENVRRQLTQAQQTIACLHQSIAVWKEVSAKMSARVDEIKDGTNTLRLERERDFYKARWDASTQAVARLIEHQGNVELLEAELSSAERSNALLRARVPS